MMRRLDQLELAITGSGVALLTPVVREFAWGPVQESHVFAGGRVFGRIATSPWNTRAWLTAAAAGLTVVSLWPMLNLPSDIVPPAPGDFADVLFRVLTASGTWILWCEPDFDQSPVPEKVMTAEEASRSVQQCLHDFSSANLIAYSSSAASRLPREHRPA